MSTMSHHRGRIAALSRSRSVDDPELVDARRSLKCVQATEYIRRLVDEAPPLTEAQRAKLAALLAPAPREAV